MEDHQHHNHPCTPAQPAVPTTPPAQLASLPSQPAPVPQLNWSHFKLEFVGKPDEDAEVHLLRTNNWMDTHAFLEGVTIQIFCLTFGGEARLWYEVLRSIVLD